MELIKLSGENLKLLGNILLGKAQNIFTFTVLCTLSPLITGFKKIKY